ncbi:MAG: Asp-tRNA(Asn)/Glu-tRNA(Gln) amidotransferase subunit GatC [Oligoflexus sp.]
MSQIDRQTVEKIAGLASLKLSEEEVLYYQDQLSRILDYMDQLKAFPDGLPATWRAELEQAETPERPDRAEPSHVIEKVLQSAPRVVGTAFQVPRIIE